jgi:hypothetical protein
MANSRVSINAKRSRPRIIAGRNPYCDFADGGDFEAGPITLRAQVGSPEDSPYALRITSFGRDCTEKLFGL